MEILEAIRNHNIDGLREILATGEVDINSTYGPRGFTALHLALTPTRDAGGGGHEEIIRVLICAGADIHIPDKDDKFPIYYAIQGEYTNIIEIFLDAGWLPSMNVIGCLPGERGIKALHLAARFFSINAEIGFYNQDSALTYIDMITLLLKRGANPSEHDLRGLTPLHIISNGDLVTIPRGFRAARNVSWLEMELNARSRYQEMVERVILILIEGGADIESRTMPWVSARDVLPADTTPLWQRRARERHINNLTPLHLAVKQGNSIVTKALVNMGADIFAKSGLLGGDTALTLSRDQLSISGRGDKERVEVSDILWNRRVELFRSLQRLALGIGLYLSHDGLSIEDRPPMDRLTEKHLGKDIAGYMDEVPEWKIPLLRVPTAHPLIHPDQWLRYQASPTNLLMDAGNEPEPEPEPERDVGFEPEPEPEPEVEELSESEQAAELKRLDRVSCLKKGGKKKTRRKRRKK